MSYISGGSLPHFLLVRLVVCRGKALAVCKEAHSLLGVNSAIQAAPQPLLSHDVIELLIGDRHDGGLDES
jgi:hypothetical protein